MNMEDKFNVTNEFHDHLDVCPHCREHVFNLCPVGAMALRRSVDEPFAKRTSGKVIEEFSKAVRKYQIVKRKKRNEICIRSRS